MMPWYVELAEAAEVKEKLGMEIQEKEMVECAESGRLLGIVKIMINEHVQENILGINGVLIGSPRVKERTKESTKAKVTRVKPKEN